LNVVTDLVKFCNTKCAENLYSDFKYYMWTNGEAERYFEVNSDLGWEGPGNITQNSDVH